MNTDKQATPATNAAMRPSVDELAQVIATELAKLDGCNPEDLRGGLYDVRWSGGPNPEPEGDAWNMDYMPKGEHIAKVLRELDAAQPAQAGEPVYQVKFRTQGSGWVTVDRESYESPLAYLPEHYERRVVYVHPQPEQPASAEQDALRELVNAGNALSFAAQLTGGVAGRDEALVAAIDAWTKSRDAATATPAVSPPSVVAVTPEVVSAPKVAVSDEDVEVAAKAAFESSVPGIDDQMTWEELVAEQPNFADEIRGVNRAALESFAQRIAGSVPEGWKEAAIAWNVCASIHREYAKGKDPMFNTRQADFVKAFRDARGKIAAAPRLAETQHTTKKG